MEDYPGKREQPALGRTISDINKLYQSAGTTPKAASSGSRTQLTVPGKEDPNASATRGLSPGRNAVSPREGVSPRRDRVDSAKQLKALGTDIKDLKDAKQLNRVDNALSLLSGPRLLFTPTRSWRVSAPTPKNANDRIAHAKAHKTVVLNLNSLAFGGVLPNELFELIHLSTLNLESNELNALPPAFTSLQRLKRLSLKNNKFQQIPKLLGELAVLRQLDLSENHIATLPADFGASLSRLEHLNLSHNRITQIPPGVNALVRLEVLDVSYNQLEELPKEIGNLNVEHLLLSHNKLRNLPPTVGLLQNMILLDLTNNDLMKLPPELGELIYCLKQIKLSENPLVHPLSDLCLKGTSNLLEYLQERQHGNIQDLYQQRQAGFGYQSVDFSTFLLSRRAGGKKKEEEEKKVLKLQTITQLGAKDSKTKLEVGGQFDMVFAPPRKSLTAEQKALIANTKGFNMELGRALLPAEQGAAEVDSSQFNSDYEQFFFAKAKADFIGTKEGTTPISVTISKEAEPYQGAPCYRTLVRSKFGDARYFLSATEDTASWAGKEAYPSSKSLLRSLTKSKPELKEFDLRLVCDRNWPKAYRELERKMTMNCMSVGVLYVRENQNEENQFYANQNPSKAFEDMLSCIAQKVPLRGWTAYNGGLDVETGTTGEFAYYSSAHAYEILYHVAPLLPYDENDPEKMERKRHLQNDICVVVFVDGERTPFNPALITSQFNQVFIVVQVDRSRTDDVYYKVGVTYREGVNIPLPPLGLPAVFKRGPEFAKWIAIKMINAERAAYTGPSFGPLIQTVREDLIATLVAQFKDVAQEV